MIQFDMTKYFETMEKACENPNFMGNQHDEVKNSIQELKKEIKTKEIKNKLKKF
jgi:hypothetical protein